MFTPDNDNMDLILKVSKEINKNPKKYIPAIYYKFDEFQSILKKFQEENDASGVGASALLENKSLEVKNLEFGLSMVKNEFKLLRNFIESTKIHELDAMKMTLDNLKFELDIVKEA